MNEDLPSRKESEPVTLKEGTEADFETILALELKVASRTYVPFRTIEEIAGSKKFFYLVKAGERTVGHVIYKIKDDGVIYLSGFVIDPEYQGKGYGKDALKQFIAKVKNAPAIDLVTHPDNPAINLYKSVGFKITEIKDDYFGDGEPRVVMVLENRSIKHE